MAKHDQAYKLLFSHPQMVRDLLEGFVREDWIAEMDVRIQNYVSLLYQDLIRTKQLAAPVRLENSRTPADVLRIVRSLAEWLKAPEQASLRRAFVVWINRVILARKPGGPVVGVEELEVMSTLLEVRMREWDEASREKGREEGLQEGLQEGLREGEALLLHRLLRQRFGELPDWVWPRLQQADTAQLDQWGERVLSADSLGAVFGEE